MKTILAAAAIAATVFTGSAVSANAATTLIAPGTADFGATHASSSTTAYQTFTDTYTFTLPGAGDFDLSVTNSFATMAQKIKNFTLTLMFPGGFSVSPITQTTGSSSLGKQTAELLGTLAQGTYTFTVSGDYSPLGSNKKGGGSYGGSLATSVSAVPLPGSVALFGTALAGLGVAGAMRRKGNKTAAAV